MKKTCALFTMIFIFISLMAVEVDASTIGDQVLPEYSSNLIDYSNVDENYFITDNYQFETNLDRFETNAPKESDDSYSRSGFVNPQAKYTSVHVKDGYESNDSLGKASNLGVLVSDYALGIYTSGTIHDTGPNYQTDRNHRDVDYFEFTTQEPYKFQVQLTNIPEGCDYDIVLYVKTKTWLVFNKYTQVGSSKRGSNYNELIDSYHNQDTGEFYDYLPEGTYVIEIYSYKGVSSQRYGLRVGFNGLPDDYEENNTKSSAYQYNLPSLSSYNTSLQGTIDRNDDVDWFVITPPKYNSRITINLRSPASNYKYKMELYNGSTLVTTNYESNVLEDKYTNLQLIHGNTYYIKIYSEGQTTHSTKFKYTLQFSGTNSDSVYNYKNSYGNWIQYGMIWTYDAAASTKNGYSAKKYYSLNESYLYMTEKIYLYNMNPIDIGRAMGAFDKLIEILETRPSYLETLKEDLWTSVGTGVFDFIMKKSLDFNPYTLAIQLGYTTYEFYANDTLSQYEVNLYSYMSEQLKKVANDIDNYRIEIEVYTRAGSNDKYIYLNFINNDDLYAPDFFADTIYSNQIVYGNISYINSATNTSYINKYLFNANNKYKNNFPW